jgi:hypothetical protein
MNEKLKTEKMRSVEFVRIKKLLRFFDYRFDKLMRDMTAELEAISFTKKRERAMLAFFSKLSDNYSKTIHDLLAASIESKQRKSLSRPEDYHKKMAIFFRNIYGCSRSRL